MTSELLLQLALVCASGAGVYAAIKSDLTRSITKAEQACKDADKAHERIDAHIENHK